MTARQAFTRALLAFVVISFGYLAVRSLQAARAWRPPAVSAAQSSAPPAAGAPAKVIAYYFHVTVRCTTCRNIEEYSREVIQSRFAEPLASGKLEWRLVNVQLPENEHFVDDYKLYTKSLVLVRTGGGLPDEYKVLHRTWDLVGDKPAMQDYVENEVRAFLRKIG